MLPCSSTDLLVGSDELHPLSLQVLLQTGGGAAICGAASQLQLQLPGLLLLTFALSRLRVNSLLRLDQLGLNLLQLCTELKGTQKQVLNTTVTTIVFFT